MKVLQINNCHYRRGGSEAVYFGTADLLREAGHEIVFFSIADSQNIETESKSYFVENRGGVGRIKNYFNNTDAAAKLEEVLKTEKPDIAHAHLFWGGISPSIFRVLKRHGVPLVHTAHDYRMVCPAYLLKDGNGRFCERCKGGHYIQCALHRCSKGSLVESVMMSAEMYYRNNKWHPVKEIDGIVFVSNFSKNKHIEFDKRFSNANTLVLYNCPDVKVRESLDMQRNTYESYYLFYGRLSEEKGIQTLIKAFEKLPQLQLRIVGSGPLENDLKKYCEEKKLANVEFLGYKSGKDLYDMVACAKYVCVPSECYENNPMTIVESYSLGTPVIGAAIGGISEIVLEGDTGFVFESGSVKSLIQALYKSSKLGVNDYMQQKKQAYRFGLDNFSREVHYKKLMEFYKQIIQNKR